MKEIANYQIGEEITARLIAIGKGIVTKTAIDRLIKHLELAKECFPLDNKKGDISVPLDFKTHLTNGDEIV